MIFGTVCILGLICALLLTNGSHAKRGPRPLVGPVQLDGVEFRAPNTGQTEGYVEAWDVNSRKFLWRRKVYFSPWIPLLEPDNQWVFITSMTIDSSNKELIVVNERGKSYKVSTAPPWKWRISAGMVVGLFAFIGTIVILRQHSKD